MARPRLITDAQILTKMRSCVLEHGAQVSLETVAMELGVTAPALLKRFGNRQQLMLQALQPPLDPEFIANFAKGPDDRPMRVQLAERLDEMWTFFSTMLPCVSALRESGIPQEKIFEGKHRNPLRALQAIAHWLELSNQAGLTDVPSPESAATAILGAVQARIFASHISKTKYSTRSTREYLADLVEFFLRALAVTGRRIPPSDPS
jgi:AcrR family transcriptional regulator